jgi:hypothetical protein
MRAILIKYLLLLNILTLLVSCSVSTNYFPKDQITKINENPSYEKPKYVDVFFKNEKLDFDYTKISYIEVEQGTNEELLIRLKYLAYEQNANAIIEVEFYKTIGSYNTYKEEEIISINSAKAIAVFAPSIIDTTKNDPSIEFNYQLQKDDLDERRETSHGILILIAFITTITTIILIR